MGHYTLPDMPYDYGALEPAMSGEILELHHDKHHAAYVKGANDALERLAEARDKGDFGDLVGLEKTSRSTCPATSCTRSSGRTCPRTAATVPTVSSATPSTSTSAPSRRSQASSPPPRRHRAGLRLGRAGLGAARPAPDRRAGLRPPRQRRHGSTPLLVFDAWEHAYYLQYRNVRPDYVEKLWGLINWNDVIARFNAAKNATGF